MNNRLFNYGMILLLVGGMGAVASYSYMGSISWVDRLLDPSTYNTLNGFMWIGIVMGGIGLLLVIMGLTGLGNRNVMVITQYPQQQYYQPMPPPQVYYPQQPVMQPIVRCRNCGSPWEGGSFCKHCGAKFG